MVLKKAGKTLPNVKLNSIVNLLKIKKNCDLQWDIQRTNKKCKSNLSALNVPSTSKTAKSLIISFSDKGILGKMLEN